MSKPDATMFRTIVVPLDGSPFSATALPVATALAHDADAELRAIGIARNDGEMAWTYDHVHAEARAGSPLTAADIKVVTDPNPVGLLLDLADDPEILLCLASHDRMPLHAKLTRSVGSEVIERAEHPLVAVGPNANPRSLGPDVVVALDARGDPEPLLTVAAMSARRLGCPLRIVTVYEPVPPDLRHPSHFSRMNGPGGDPDAFVSSMRERVDDIGLARIDTVAVADAVGTASGLLEHLSERPGRLLVVGGGRKPRSPKLKVGVARHVLAAATLPLLIVNGT